jgi:hypothetical protein
MLKESAPDYKKNNLDVIASFLSRTDTAIKNADKALRQAQANDNFNPSTEVHEVIETLRSFM